jgi:hypothetical protein
VAVPPPLQPVSRPDTKARISRIFFFIITRARLKTSL